MGFFKIVKNFKNTPRGWCHNNFSSMAADLTDVVKALKNKLAAMEELVQSATRNNVSPTSSPPSSPPRKRRARRRQTGKKRRASASTHLKCLRDKFKTVFLTKVDARYLAPKDSYKMYKPGPRGETVQISKFIKVLGPILKRLMTKDDEEDERLIVREVICLLANNNICLLANN